MQLRKHGGWSVHTPCTDEKQISNTFQWSYAWNCYNKFGGDQINDCKKNVTEWTANHNASQNTL